MSLFDDVFIHNLPEDPKLAGFRICEFFRDKYLRFGYDDIPFEICVEAYVTLEIISDENGLGWIFLIPDELSNNQIKEKIVIDIYALYDTLNKYSQNHERVNLKEKYVQKYLNSKKGAFLYEFSDGDLVKLQGLINDLRENIVDSELFDESHKRRLLKRLEYLQQEIHKTQSDLDHYWGLVGDAGVAIGKFGNDAKPFVKLIKEITNVVWRTQAKAEELSSDSSSPLLSNEVEKI